MTYAERKSPQLDYLTYPDLAAMLGHSKAWVKREMPKWEARGFPAPAPWWRREKRWHAASVRRWFEREERLLGAHGAPDFRIIEGGRACPSTSTR